MELNKAQVLGVVSLVMILSGTVAVSNMSQSYYCQPEDSVRECLRVSSSGLTCYYLGAEDLTKGDRCVGGAWEPLEGHISAKSESSVKIEANGKEWSCDASTGFISPYTRCHADESEGYLGELLR